MEMEEACHGCTKVRPDSEVANAIPPVRSIGGGDKTSRDASYPLPDKQRKEN